MVQELQRAGWLRARALTGGLTAWANAGLPVEAKVEPVDSE